MKVVAVIMSGSAFAVLGICMVAFAQPFCEEGCSDSHEAESWGGAGDDVNCRVFVGGTRCVWDWYDLVETVVPNANQCSVKVPNDNMQYYACMCDEHCANAVPNTKREMKPPTSGSPPTIDISGCNGPYSTYVYECIPGH